MDCGSNGQVSGLCLRNVTIRRHSLTIVGGYNKRQLKEIKSEIFRGVSSSRLLKKGFAGGGNRPFGHLVEQRINDLRGE
jgi:hypothetical protein